MTGFEPAPYYSRSNRATKLRHIPISLFNFLIIALNEGFFNSSFRKKTTQGLFEQNAWCAQRDLNPHGRPLVPKTSASANSAMRAFKSW